MRTLIQRVSEASVVVDDDSIGQIGNGLLVLVCAMTGDTDEQGKMNRSIQDVGGAALVVSQFTLAADTSRGNRPGFSSAASPEDGERLYQRFCDLLSGHGVPVQTGKFGADMKVRLVNDGPVTIWLDTQEP